MARLEQLLDQIRKGKDIRQNLIEIRKNISDESLRRRFMYQLEGDFSLLAGLLKHEDPKVRKNAALILGMTDDEDVLPALFEAWEKEETLFVREAYLKAVSGLDYREYLPRLKDRILELEKEMEASSEASEQESRMEHYSPSVRAQDMEVFSAAGEQDMKMTPADVAPDSLSGNPLWDNNTHLLAELSLLRQMTARYEKHGRHRFTSMNPAPELLLRTNLLHAEVTARQVTCGTTHIVRGGVQVKGGDLNELMKIRTWTECLLPIPGARAIQGDERMIASRLRDLKIGNYLQYLHEDSGQPFRYRIELKSAAIPREKKGEYIRRIASRLDLLEKGRLLNSESDYEVELRLIERKDRSLIPMLKLFTLPDNRFSYRKETTAQSTSAPLAALAVELARPYLKESAQILDPFCGTGTLLIERCIAIPADPVYGVDHFAEAIAKARVNSRITDQVRLAPIHYINRDFFDFTHEYPFDEIITFLPDAEALREADFAGRFLLKAQPLLTDEAVLIILTNAPEALKDAVSKTSGYTVAEEYLLNERSGCSELILKNRPENAEKMFVKL